MHDGAVIGNLANAIALNDDPVIAERKEIAVVASQNDTLSVQTFSALIDEIFKR